MKGRLAFGPALILTGVVAGAATLWFTTRAPEFPGYLVRQTALVQTVVASGRVISVSRVQVGSEITATVVERRVAEGDRVKPGDVLVVLRADDLAARAGEAAAALDALLKSSRPQALAAARQSATQAEQASRERTRRADLADRGLIARESLEQAQEAETVAREAATRARLQATALAAGGAEETQARARLAAARAALARTELRSTVSGVVLTRDVEAGDLVQPGRVLLTIARDGVTEIEVPVDEKNLGLLADGQSARCIADAYPDRPFDGRVSWIAPAVDVTRGSVDIRVRVEPAPPFLRQDMTVSVNVETGRRDAALTVPNDALRGVASERATVRAVRDGRVVELPVRLGLRGLTASEVVDGLAVGDLVLAGVADGTAEPGSRARVRVTASPDAGGNGAERRELPVSLD